MRLIKGQMTLFDLIDEPEEEEPSFSIAEFDRRFRVGSRFFNGRNIVEVTNIRKGEQNAEIKNVTLEQKGWYVGSRYYINKESYGTWYQKEESWDINKLTEIEMVDIVNRECGLNLKVDKFFEDYRQKLKHGWVIAVEYSNYFADDDDEEIYNDLDGNGARFVDLSIMSPKGGFGMPCDSLEECIETIKGWIEKQDMR